VAQHIGSSGADLIRGIATGYEIQVNLVKAICLHKHKIDHVAHLGPSAAAGIGTLLGSTSKQSSSPWARPCTPPLRPGSPARVRSPPGRRTLRRSQARWPWKRRTGPMRGQTSPVPIYEGEDGVIAWLLDGPDASYQVPLPHPGRPSAPSWTPTPRNTPPSTRPRPGSTSPVNSTTSIPN
jgi:2-methylcitrate dehydratase